MNDSFVRRERHHCWDTRQKAQLQSIVSTQRKTMTAELIQTYGLKETDRKILTKKPNGNCILLDRNDLENIRMAKKREYYAANSK